MLKIRQAITTEDMEAIKSIRKECYHEIARRGAALSGKAREIILSEKAWTAETDERYVHLLAFSDRLAGGCVTLFFPGPDGKLHSEAIGDLEAHKSGRCAEALKFMVSMNCIEKGVGNALMYTVYDVFRRLKFDQLFINVIQDNRFTNQLYKKFGFEVVKEEEIFDTRMDILRLNIPAKASNPRYARYFQYMGEQKKVQSNIAAIIEGLN